MSQFASAAFTGTQFTELSAADANWSKQSGYTENLILGAGGTYVISNTNVGAGVYQHAGTPAGADYTVAADITKLTGNTGNNRMGVCGRMQSGVRTMYFALYSHDLGNIRLLKDVAGTTTTLGTYSFTLTGTPARLLLRMVGDQISVELNGTPVIGPVTDTSITTAGKAGVYALETRQTGVADAGSIDNFSADNVGSSGGATANGVTLTATASLIAGSASGPVGTLNFQAAGMEFGRRTGLAISTFALDASQSYRYTVHADGLVLGAPIFTSGVVATDATGKLPNASNAAFVAGATVWVCAVRQADGQRAVFPMVVA